MNDVELLKEHQSLQNLNCNSPYQIDAQTFELVESHKFVQVDMQKLKDEAGVTSKKECVLELNDIVVRIVVMHKDCLQYPNLNFGLLVELWMILYYF